MSETNARIPRTRLRPPLSMAAFHAAGFRYGLLLGADAAIRLVSTNFSRVLSRQSSSAPASMSPALLAISGVIPFGETIFLWQSVLLTAVLVLVSLGIAAWSAPAGEQARTAQDLGVDLKQASADLPPVSRPGEWLERSPVLSLLRSNPFPDAPPRYVRAMLYEYHFTSPAERARTHQWWKREVVRVYFPPVSLNDARFRDILERQGWLVTEHSH